MIRLYASCLLIAAALSSNAATVVDDMGRSVTVTEAPQRIISLAPHLTEMLFGLGVGDRIVATVAYSDYPEAAKTIPRLGDAFAVSLEAVLELDPQLIVAWQTGGNGAAVERLKSMGYPVYVNEAKTLEDIALTMQKLGQLVHEEAAGNQISAEFSSQLQRLREQAQGQGKRVFFQIADDQLYSVNEKHLIGQALSVCGAENVFEALEIKVPIVSLEAVVRANPEVVLMSRPLDEVSRWESEWRRLGWDDRIRYLDASLVTRPSHNMIKGIKNLCQALSD